MNDLYPLVTQLQSVTFSICELELKRCIDSLPPSLPWYQLRSLTFDTYMEDLDLDLVFGILRQTPRLETLDFTVFTHPVS